MMETLAILVPRKVYRSGLTFWLSALTCTLLLNSCAIMPASEIAYPGRFEFAVIGDQQYTAEDERNFPT